jgi:hypothetical protein
MATICPEGPPRAVVVKCGAHGVTLPLDEWCSILPFTRGLIRIWLVAIPTKRQTSAALYE